ncbi:cystathionine beta-synthase [Caulobacter sp. D4A]|uniref:pyridoxal-phosphate dependent enzyme n=1 Tax=unclassified Caulobacter TaxID=2648921 RepID=UPI000D731055|nr:MULTISPECIES: cystathionine beta-synthase [unclassified Caulobacter]PXA90288.1 cystathionine beta-synthase [Caulobacter sp. D4A]PXA96400.1 cystathionine beta-synthase [Caulobacter sp. D5]
MNDPKSALPPVAGSALDLIGRTPMLEVRNLDTGPCRLFLKLESQNPGGSIKDRVARSMIEAAEADGSLKPGGTIIEATAGNTGLGLAQVAALKGYKLILIVPDKMAREKILHLRAMGVDVRLTRSDVGKGHPEYYQDMAQALAQSIPGAIYANQFENPANPRAHYVGTGPEILAQMDGDVDAVVVGVGSGGTLTGVGRYMAEQSPKTKMVLADPVGSILCDYVATGTYGEAGSWIVEGIGEDFIPDNAQMDLVSKAYSISDRESVDTARLLLRKEGVLAGSSSGTLLAAALRYCREQTQPKRVVTLVCDTGAKYLTKMFNDMWLAAHGFDQRELHGDLRDLIAKRYADGGVIAIGPGDTLLTAYNRMRSSDISQLPVVDHGRLVGILDESDILAAVEGRDEHRGARFKTPVADAMTRQINTLQAHQGVEALPDVFERDEVALVVDGEEFLGVITRVDLLNHLRLEA